MKSNTTIPNEPSSFSFETLSTTPQNTLFIYLTQQYEDAKIQEARSMAYVALGHCCAAKEGHMALCALRIHQARYMIRERNVTTTLGSSLLVTKRPSPQCLNPNPP